MKQRIVYIIIIIAVFVGVAYLVSSTESQYLDTSTDSTYCELYQSIRDNDQAKLDDILESNLDLNIKGCQNDELPLFFAIKYNVDVAFFQKLENAGMSVTYTNIDNKTAIQYAYVQEADELVAYLIDNPYIDLDHIDSTNMSLIDYVMNEFDIVVLDQLLEKGVEIKITDETNIFDLYQTRNIELVKQFIENGYNLNTKNSDGLTLLQMVMKTNDFSMIRYLVKQGADIYTEYDGENLMSYAIRNNDLALVEQLIALGYDLNQENNSPLFDAVEYANQAMLRLLLENGSNPNVYNDDNELLSYEVIRNNELAILDILLENGMDINFKNASGDNLLASLFKVDSTPDHLKLLLDKGASLYTRNNFGKMPLNFWFDKLTEENLYAYVDYINELEIKLQFEAFQDEFVSQMISNEKRLVYLKLLNGLGYILNDYISTTELLKALDENELLRTVNEKKLFEAITYDELSALESFTMDIYISFKMDANPNAGSFKLNQEYLDKMKNVTAIENLYLSYIENGTTYYTSLIDFAVMNESIEQVDLLIENGFNKKQVTLVDELYNYRTPMHYARSLEMIQKLESIGYSVEDTYNYRSCSNGCVEYRGINMMNNIDLLSDDLEEVLIYLGENNFNFMSMIEVYSSCTITFDCKETPDIFFTHLHSIIGEQRVPIEVIDTYVRKAVEYDFDIELEDSNGKTIIDYLEDRNESEEGEKIIKTLIREISK